MYSQAMKIAKGANCGITEMMKRKDAKNDRHPLRALFNEFCRFESTVFISDVNLFKIRPIGVVSKNRGGARASRLSI